MENWGSPDHIEYDVGKQGDIDMLALLTKIHAGYYVWRVCIDACMDYNIVNEDEEHGCNACDDMNLCFLEIKCKQCSRVLYFCKKCCMSDLHGIDIRNSEKLVFPVKDKFLCLIPCQVTDCDNYHANLELDIEHKDLTEAILTECE